MLAYPKEIIQGAYVTLLDVAREPSSARKTEMGYPFLYFDPIQLLESLCRKSSSLLPLSETPAKVTTSNAMLVEPKLDAGPCAYEVANGRFREVKSR